MAVREPIELPALGQMSTKKKHELPGQEAHEEHPAENARDDPRQKTDWPNTKQTDDPWKGFTEKEQRNDDTKIDLEKWHRTNTH